MFRIFHNLDPDDAAAWSDVISLVLLGFNILVGGIDPARHLWGRSIFRNVLICTSLSASIAFTVLRFAYEGLNKNPGPREFLAGSVIYSARWIWLWISISRKDTRGGRMYHVGQALKHLYTLRLGKSTHDSDMRKGKQELVLRCGARHIPSKEPEYWRGYNLIEPVLHHSVQTWEVHLLERNLHAEQLDALGTIEYRRKEPFATDDVYKRFYDLVMTTHMTTEDIIVDFSPFTDEYKPVGITRRAERMGATDPTDLGGVARRIAADATLYISRKRADFRAPKQVRLLNSCLKQAAKEYFQGRAGAHLAPVDDMA